MGRTWRVTRGLFPRVERSGGRQWERPHTKAGSPWSRVGLDRSGRFTSCGRQDDFGRWARRLAVRKGILKARVAVRRRAVRRAVHAVGRGVTSPASAIGEGMATEWSICDLTSTRSQLTLSLPGELG